LNDFNLNKTIFFGSYISLCLLCSLIVAAPEMDVETIVQDLLPLLSYSAPFVIYHQYLQVWHLKLKVSNYYLLVLKLCARVHVIMFHISMVVTDTTAFSLINSKSILHVD